VAKTVERNGTRQRTDFLWQGLRLLQERSGDSQSLYLYEPDSYAPLARVDGKGKDAQLYYFHTDQIGTPLDVSDAEGQLVWQATYKAWGEVETYHTHSIEQNLRFQGQYFDQETGLHYNTFRYYDPVVGRFTAQDPIGLLGGNNLYQYAENPVKWSDPLGWIPLARPVNQGHHMVPHTAASDLGIKPFNSQFNVPAMYWNEPGQWTGLEHSGMHGYNGIESDTRPLVKASEIKAEGMSRDAWMKSLENHYNNPEIAHYRGDLRLVGADGKPGQLIASNVSPSQGWKATLKWAKGKGFNFGGCSS